MGGAMKGQNNMKNKAGFKVGDKVRYLTPTVGGIKSLRGLTGTIRYVDDIGAEVVFKTNKGEKIYTLANCDMIKVNNAPVTTAPANPREMANDKNNVWAISIMPAPFDRERTVADLIVNGRIVDTITVSRWHEEDKYDIGMAAYEAIKQMFDIKDKKIEKVSDNKTTPKWFNGKVVCVKGSMFFTTGRIYDVVEGVLIDNVGVQFCYFTDVDDMNNRMSAKFIEVI